MHDAFLVFIGFFLGGMAGVASGISAMLDEKPKKRRFTRQRFFRCNECGLDLTRGGESLHEGKITIKRCDHCGSISNWLKHEGEYIPVIRPLKQKI